MPENLPNLSATCIYFQGMATYRVVNLSIILKLLCKQLIKQRGAHSGQTLVAVRSGDPDQIRVAQEKLTFSKIKINLIDLSRSTSGTNGIACYPAACRFWQININAALFIPKRIFKVRGYKFSEAIRPRTVLSLKEMFSSLWFHR